MEGGRVAPPVSLRQLVVEWPYPAMVEKQTDISALTNRIMSTTCKILICDNTEHSHCRSVAPTPSSHANDGNQAYLESINSTGNSTVIAPP
jgi:hypothetical protein